MFEMLVSYTGLINPREALFAKEKKVKLYI